MPTKLLLVGGGKMGSAMLQGWLQRSLSADDVTIIEPHDGTAETLRATFNVDVHPDAAAVPEAASPETVVFAVKPQMMDEVIGPYAAYADNDCLFLSIAAGKTIAYFEDRLSKSAPVVRAMPNTPAAVGRGITVCCANAHVSAAQRAWTGELLEAVGEVAWVDAEEHIDAVTAVSGGGPAYVFLLAEVMAQAGIDAGLPVELAHQLARVTVAGAGELLHQSDEDPAVLRQNVTSPGGTTAEALKVLMAHDAWQPLMTEAIKQATRRSRELAG